MATAADKSKAIEAALRRGLAATACRVHGSCPGLALVADAAALLLARRKERIRAEKRHVEQGRSARPFIVAQERENAAAELLRHALGRCDWESGVDQLCDLACKTGTQKSIGASAGETEIT